MGWKAGANRGHGDGRATAAAPEVGRFAEEPLRGAAYHFAARLTEAGRGGDVHGAVSHRAQVEFMDAAHDDLWPGRRRTVGVANP